MSIKRRINANFRKLCTVRPNNNTFPNFLIERWILHSAGFLERREFVLGYTGKAGYVERGCSREGTCFLAPRKKGKEKEKKVENAITLRALSRDKHHVTTPPLRQRPRSDGRSAFAPIRTSRHFSSVAIGCNDMCGGSCSPNRKISCRMSRPITRIQNF